MEEQLSFLEIYLLLKQNAHKKSAYKMAAIKNFEYISQPITEGLNTF